MVCFSRDSLEKIRKEEILAGLRDSKQLSEEKRNAFAKEILIHALRWKVVFVSAKFIDRWNINQAIFYGINRAIPSEFVKEPFLFVDGNYKIKISKPILGYQSFTKGDDLLPSISAASILAKTFRDQYLINLEKKYPGYGFAKHKGYGTEFHRKQIVKLGISPVHRLSFLKFLRKEKEEGLFDYGESV